MSESDLSAEILRLRQAQRNLWRYVIGLTILLVLVGVAGANPFSQARVETQTLVLTDARGHIRCMLAATEKDTGFVLTDHLGNKRIKMLVTNGVPEIHLLDSREHTQVALRGSPNGGVIELAGEDQQPQVVISGQESSPQIQLYGAKGKPRLSLFALEKSYRDVAAGVSVLDSEGQLRILLSEMPETGGSLRVMNLEGTSILSAP